MPTTLTLCSIAEFGRCFAIWTLRSISLLVHAWYPSPPPSRIVHRIQPQNRGRTFIFVCLRRDNVEYSDMMLARISQTIHVCLVEIFKHAWRVCSLNESISPIHCYNSSESDLTARSIGGIMNRYTLRFIRSLRFTFMGHC